METRFSILNKGLVFITIPLLLQVFFFVQLLNLVDYTQELSRQQALNNRIIPLIAEAFVKFGNVWADIGASALTPDLQSGNLDNTRAYTEEINALLREMKVVAKDYKPLEPALAVAQKMQKEQTAVLENFQHEPHLSLTRIVEFKKHLRGSISTAREMEVVLHQQRRSLEEKSQQIAREQVRIRNVVLGGFVVDFLLTLILLLIFLSNIAGRLRLLVRNARNLPTGEKFVARVEGKDELAYLDEVLFDAAARLKRAAQYRNSMLSMLAHDMRTPLLNANLALEILENPQVSDERREKYLVSVRNNHQWLLTLIDDLITIEKLKEGELELTYELFNLNDLLNVAINNLKNKSEVKQVNVQVRTGNVEILADSKRILRVVTNLIGNAIRYSPVKSSVVVTCQSESESITVIVKDDGPGVAKADQLAIFEKYYQGEHSEKALDAEGFGLGLAICKLIVEAHGGEIGVESDTGDGSSFWFRLPSHM